MKEERLYQILGQIDEDLIEEAATERLPHSRKPSQPLLRLGLTAALALLIGLASFSTAFTVNAKFRRAVIELFHLQQTESVPQSNNQNGQNNSNDSKQISNPSHIRLYQSGTIEDIFTVQYLESDAYIQAMDDIFYYSNVNGEQTFYQASGNSFIPVPAHSIRQDVSLHGIAGHIDYSCCLSNDRISLIENSRSRIVVSEDTEFMYTLEGTTLQNLSLILYKNPLSDKWSYPVKYDLTTNEITDYLKDITIDGISLFDSPVLNNWTYVDENTRLVCAGENRNLYRLDLKTNTSVNISDLFDIPSFNGIKVLDRHLFVLTPHSPETFDYTCYDLDTGEESIVYEDISYWSQSTSESNYRVGFTGGKYDLVQKDELIYLSDELTQTMTLIDGIDAELAQGPLINKAGDKILVSRFGEDCIEQIGIIDTDTLTFYLLDRSNTKTHEQAIFWNDDDHIALEATNDDYSRSYVYLYSLKK